MPYNYKSPGVYIEEGQGGARPIESASTAVLAMVGLCRDVIQVDEVGKGLVSKPTPNTPTLITNWSQFINTYGDLDQAYPGGYLHQAMQGYFLNGGSAAYVVGLPAPVKVEQQAPAGQVSGKQTPLLTAGEGYVLAGGRALRLTTSKQAQPGEEISIEVQPPAEGAPPDSFNLVVKRGNAEPRVIPNVSVTKAKGVRNVADVATKETDNLLQVEVVDPPANMAAISNRATLVVPAEQSKGDLAQQETKRPIGTDLFKGSSPDRTGIAGLEAIDDVTMVACPDIVAAYQWGACSEEDVKAVQTAILNHCEMMKNRFAILDAPAGLNVQDMIAWRKERMNFDSKFGALYYPWIKADGQTVPPSGYVAGLYARVDAERGVHKAPANEIVRGAIGLERNVSRNEQDFLNPIGVNCIRSFPGQGIRVWGARTLSSDPLWRYINVRRLFSNIEESILRSTNWVVFEPNDWVLWGRITRDVSAYLTVRWREGALFGATPDQAFYVKCDEETNPQELRDLGYCIIEIGIAPVKPAEFVVFRISQKEGGSEAAA